MTFNKYLAHYKLLKKIGNPKCRIFSDGYANIESKRVNVNQLYDQIIDFHDSFYSANLMTLVVLSDVSFRTLR